MENAVKYMPYPEKTKELVLNLFIAISAQRLASYLSAKATNS
jgi:hypothetical protein